MRQSKAYIQHRLSGPFPGQIDPWAEIARYFNQLHGSLITNLLNAYQIPLQQLGYEAARETSLQILEKKKPDMLVMGRVRLEPTPLGWDYAQAATAAMIEPGIQVEQTLEDELDAIYIRDTESGSLVTILEIVSPSNKVDWDEIEAYQRRRSELLRDGVNVVEIDLTRSIKRLVEAAMQPGFLYHIAIHLHNQGLRLIDMYYGEPTKRFALPLTAAILPMDLQPLYDQAYQSGAIAGQIYTDARYTERDLPFPSLLNAEQRQSALQTAGAWAARLEALHTEQP
jgi:hypothetical protein